jgi:hypothetical protein
MNADTQGLYPRLSAFLRGCIFQQGESYPGKKNPWHFSSVYYIISI